MDLGTVKLNVQDVECEVITLYTGHFFEDQKFKLEPDMAKYEHSSGTVLFKDMVKFLVGKYVFRKLENTRMVRNLQVPHRINLQVVSNNLLGKDRKG